MKCIKGKSQNSQEMISSDGDIRHGAPSTYERLITSKLNQNLYPQGRCGEKFGTLNIGLKSPSSSGSSPIQAFSPGIISQKEVFLDCLYARFVEKQLKL
jgi:hypothetical protein